MNAGLDEWQKEFFFSLLKSSQNYLIREVFILCHTYTRPYFHPVLRKVLVVNSTDSNCKGVQFQPSLPSSDLGALLLAPGEGSRGEHAGVFRCRGTVPEGGQREQILLRQKSRQRHDIKAGKSRGSSSKHKIPQNPAAVLHLLLKKISWMAFFFQKRFSHVFLFFLSHLFSSPCSQQTSAEAAQQPCCATFQLPALLSQPLFLHQSYHLQSRLLFTSKPK